MDDDIEMTDLTQKENTPEKKVSTIKTHKNWKYNIQTMIFLGHQKFRGGGLFRRGYYFDLYGILNLSFSSFTSKFSRFKESSS